MDYKDLKTGNLYSQSMFLVLHTTRHVAEWSYESTLFMHRAHSEEVINRTIEYFNKATTDSYSRIRKEVNENGGQTKYLRPGEPFLLLEFHKWNEDKKAFAVRWKNEIGDRIWLCKILSGNSVGWLIAEPQNQEDFIKIK